MKSKKGFSLFELIITVAVLAIISTIVVATSSNKLEENRREADLVALSQVDSALMQIVTNNSVFEEIKSSGMLASEDENPSVKDRLVLEFQVKNTEKTSYMLIDDSAMIVNGSTKVSLNLIPSLFSQINDFFEDEDNKIKLSSAGYKQGTYVVTIIFNGSQISPVREYAIENDNISIINSGGQYLFQNTNA